MSVADNLISVIDVAAECGKRKATIFKIIKRLQIETKKRRRSSSGNQFVSYITQDEFKRVRSELISSANHDESEHADDNLLSEIVGNESGVFYLIQLEGNHDPGRFKVGFAGNLGDRLRALRCSAPFATVVNTWPCRRLWEKTAIDCVTVDCERLHTEVFRVDSLDKVCEKCEQFFALMPTLSPSLLGEAI